MIAIVVVAAIVITYRALSSSDDTNLEQVMQEGREYVNSDSIPQAIIALRLAMDLAKKEGNDEAFFESSVYLSMVYMNIGQHEKGYELLKNLTYVETKRKENFASQYYYRLMGFYHTYLTKDYNKSLEFSDKVIALEKKLYPGDTAFVYADMANKGETYLLAGEDEQAWNVVRQVAGSPPASYKLYLAQNEYVRSALLFKAGKLDSAYHCAKLSVETAVVYQAHDCERLALGILCKVDSARGDLNNYIIHHAQLDSLNEQLKGAEVNYRAAMTEVDYQQELIKQERSRRRLLQAMALSIVALVIVSLLAAIHLIRRNAAAQRHLDALEKKERENAIVNERLEKELLQLKMRRKDEELNVARENSARMVKRMAEKDLPVSPAEKLRELESTLREQHADFIERVEQRFPELTASDVRLMGFIRMGVKPAAMASALGISSASLNTSRYRLRKKLKLTADTDLNAFVCLL